MATKTLTEKELRSLAGLLDDEDPRSFELVRRQILDIGEPILPYLDELRECAVPDLAARADAMSRELRFQNLKSDFAAVAMRPDPDLETGALLVARFGYPGLKASVYRQWLDRVATRVQDDLPSDADAGMAFQRLNSHLFQALGFAGNQSNYYDPDNSYINRVIDTRRGIPVSLSILYLLLAKRLNLPVHGVGTPGHFLLAYKSGPHTCFIDPFNRGRLMDISEVRRMLQRSGYQFRPEFLQRCASREILVRMMRNLISIYDKASCPDRAGMLSTLVEIMLRRGSQPEA